MADRQKIRQALIEILQADTGENHSGLADSVQIRQELGLDSVDVVSLVSQIERRFRLRLTTKDLETMVTVGDLLNLLQLKLTSPKSGAA